MDAVRWIILGLLFAGLLAAWYWSKRQAQRAGRTGRNAGPSLRIAQKRWIDKGTGVCLVEAEGESYLLAYTANGGVSWQPLARQESPGEGEPFQNELRPVTEPLRFESLLSEAGLP